jgi:predicted Zn-dependent peptidase
MYKKTTLDNGVRVLTVNVPHAYSVSIGAFLGAGSRYESDNIAGVSHFIEHLLFKGTRGIPTAKELSETIESVGGLINASTGWENTTLWCRVARNHFPLAVKVLSEMLHWPLFDATEMEKERGVVLEEIRMSNDHPSYRVEALVDSILWPDQPMGRDIAGTTHSVSSVSREQLMDYYQRQYAPGNTVVCVAGNVQHEDVAAGVAGALDSWEEQEPLLWCPFQADSGGKRFVLEHRKTDQVHMCIGLPGLAREHPERRALDLMSVALGEGMSSRLFLELREKRGLAYDIHSGTSHLRDCGSLVIYCGVEPSRALQALEIILVELERLRDGLPSEELEKVKAIAGGRLLLQMESTSNLSVWGGSQELLQERIKSVEQVVKEIEAVKMEDVQHTASCIIAHDRLRLALVGPVEKETEFEALVKG